MDELYMKGVRTNESITMGNLTYLERMMFFANSKIFEERLNLAPFLLLKAHSKTLSVRNVNRIFRILLNP